MVLGGWGSKIGIDLRQQHPSNAYSSKYDISFNYFLLVHVLICYDCYFGGYITHLNLSDF